MSTHSGPAPLRTAEIFVFRAPVEHPVRTSFGIMHDRPAVLVRLEDADGRHGWGEAWCNFPSCGAEHRGRLLAETVLPLALNRAWSLPGALVAKTAHRLQVLRLQCDEPGPLDQALASLGMALWDLTARRAGKPLHARRRLPHLQDQDRLRRRTRRRQCGKGPECPQARRTPCRRRQSGLVV